jgi:hypothetical protein
VAETALQKWGAGGGKIMIARIIILMTEKIIS